LSWRERGETHVPLLLTIFENDLRRTDPSPFPTRESWDSYLTVTRDPLGRFMGAGKVQDAVEAMPAVTARSPTRHVFQEDIRWLEDMPPGGNLAKYRAEASFCWKRLRIVLEDPDAIRLKVTQLCSFYSAVRSSSGPLPPSL
jgi:hypothetical protein